MLSILHLQQLAQARIDDAQTLHHAQRYDGAVYICGYAVEVALKARICKTLKWISGFPSSEKEFKGLRDLKTHQFDTLLRFSGKEEKIKSQYLFEWNSVTQWSPELRYRPIGSANALESLAAIKAAKKLIRALK